MSEAIASPMATAALRLDRMVFTTLANEGDLSSILEGMSELLVSVQRAKNSLSGSDLATIGHVARRIHTVTSQIRSMGIQQDSDISALGMSLRGILESSSRCQ